MEVENDHETLGPFSICKIDCSMYSMHLLSENQEEKDSRPAPHLGTGFCPKSIHFKQTVES